MAASTFSLTVPLEVTSRFVPAVSRPRRVLIVSPHFAPTNGADHHRVRMALPYLRQNGWQAEILAVNPAFIESELDPELEASLPVDTVIHRCRAFSARWTRRLGFSNLGVRAYLHLRRRGNELLAQGRFDLVFFSTTQFGVLPLATAWRRRFGIPYVIDLQDEWVSDYYREHPKLRPPGGRLKYALDQGLSRKYERQVMEGADQVISVSAHYLTRLRKRRPQLSPARLHVLPFGASKRDFEYLIRAGIRQTIFDPRRGTHWVYVGRGGADTHFAAGAFFDALREAFETGRLQRNQLRVHFIGTDYAPAALSRETFLPLAARHGVADVVREHSGRIPYFTALRCLHDADALIIPGSDEPGYAASKLASYLFADRPLLALFHQDSSNAKMLLKQRGSTLVTFDPRAPAEDLKEDITERWLVEAAYEKKPSSDSAWETLDAKGMSQKLADIFDTACVPSPGNLRAWR